MPGLLTHLSVAFGGFLLILLFSNWKYGLAFCVGQLIPDVIKFGIPGIMFKTASFNEILTKPIYWQLNSFTHNFTFWVLISILVLGITFMFHRMDIMKKQRFKQWAVINAFFLLSIIIHLILDIFIIEKSYWI